MTDKAKKALDTYKKEYERLHDRSIKDPVSEEEIGDIEVHLVECAKENPKKAIRILKEAEYTPEQEKTIRIDTAKESEDNIRD